MNSKGICFILLIYLIYLLGIWAFLSGYLLKRVEINLNSTVSENNSLITCNNSSLLGFSNIVQNKHDSNSYCNSESLVSFESSALRYFKKSVIIIIDGLRYDFTISKTNDFESKPYLNKMPVFSKILKKYPEKSVLYKLLADPPTTTLQRLKGMTTGGVPTFIDIGFNFGGTEIVEDNIIRQFKNNNKKVVFLGDDTWESMYPNHFHRSYAYPSFNVKDLDTVDNGILNHIFSEMQKDDWDVIIAHFLGVDHCGHQFGPNHPAMTRKLQQMNNMIQKVVENIKEDEILFILGDHGMTETGDHGGDSKDEVSTALFVFSASKIRFNKYVRQVKSIAQIDVVPTLALLLNLPIPFSNLGAVIPDLFTLKNLSSLKPCFHHDLDPLFGGALASVRNAYQVYNYLCAYSNISDSIPLSVLAKSKIMLKKLSLLWNDIEEKKSVNETKVILYKLLHGYQEYLAYVRNECFKIFASFNVELMIVGIILLFIAVAFNLKISESYIVTAVVHIFAFFVHYLLPSPFCLYCFIVYVILYIIFKDSIRICFHDLFYVYKNFGICNIVILLLLFIDFSNSFVVYEDKIMLFLLQTVFAYQYFPVAIKPALKYFASGSEKTKKSKSSRLKLCIVSVLPLLLFLSFMICVRLSFIYHKCREEQQPCETSSLLTPIGNLAPLTSNFHVFRFLMSWVGVLIPVIAACISHSYFAEPKAYTPAIICIRYGIPFVTVCICIHWWLSVIPANIVEKIFNKNQGAIAHTAFIFTLIIMVTIWTFPILPEKPWDISTVKLYYGSHGLFLLSVLLPLYLIAGDGMSTALMLMIAAFLIVIYFNVYPESISSHKDFANALLFYLLSQHWFYGTGHQPTFSTIHWQAAFLLSDKVTTYVLPGILVVINTFSSQIVHGISLPLLIIPHTSGDVKKLLLPLMLKYIAIHGIKLLSAAVSCFFLRRHLMVWKIFTPKLIYEASAVVIMMISVLIGYFFCMRITCCYHKQLKSNFAQLKFF